MRAAGSAAAVRAAGLVAALAAVLALTGCGAGAPGPAAQDTTTIPASLLAGMRPIGRGPRFSPGVSGRPTGGCGSRPGPLRAHIELFGANRVLLIARGVGHRGGCYGNVVTLDPTGTVYFRPGATLADLFRAWGQPLSADRLASFRGRVRAYVAARATAFPPTLTEDAEIVLEVGPYVPPHAHYTFPSTRR